MRKKTILGVALGMALAGTALADEPKTVGVSRLFVPQGFDDNDEIIVVVEGVLPSTCYQLAPATVHVDYSTRKVALDVKAHVNTGSCVNVPVPFEQEVDLGSLASGEWSVETAVSGLKTKLLVEKASTSNPDEFLYAPVEHVEVAFDEAEGRWTAYLSGDILATCLALGETKILPQDQVFVVLPVLTRTSEECLPDNAHFNKKVALPANLAPGRYLLHVRSLNGRGVNHMFDVTHGKNKSLI